VATSPVRRYEREVITGEVADAGAVPVLVGRVALSPRSPAPKRPDEAVGAHVEGPTSKVSYETVVMTTVWGTTTAVGVGQPSVPFNEAEGVIEAPVPVANGFVTFVATPVDNGMVTLADRVGEALTTPVPDGTVTFSETVAMATEAAVKRGTGAEAVPTGALELADIW
jgi:hypothetical protein